MSTSGVTQRDSAVPDSVAQVAELMATYPAPWALCGGWAVDAWLGRQTRDHGDVDIAVFIQDQRALFDHLTGWQLLAHDPVFDAESPGHNAEWWDGRRRLSYPSHIHGRPPELSGPVPAGGLAWAKDGFTLDIQNCELDGDGWVFRREPPIALAVESSIRASAWGVPALAPEAILFYKGCGVGDPLTFLRRRDRLDFLALLPLLDDDQRRWLRAAIERVGHPWLAQLSA